MCGVKQNNTFGRSLDAWAREIEMLDFWLNVDQF